LFKLPKGKGLIVPIPGNIWEIWDYTILKTKRIEGLVTNPKIVIPPEPLRATRAKPEVAVVKTVPPPPLLVRERLKEWWER
jgi:hypothetical protein